MNDCPNGDVRDLLPEYLHARLDAESHARVHAHVTGCADCQEELSLLRAARAAIRVLPAIDVAAIAAAIPAYRAPVRRSWVGWRVAAAVTVMIAGGTSVVVMQNRDVLPDSTRVVAVVPNHSEPVVPVVRVDTPAASVPVHTPAPAPRAVVEPAHVASHPPAVSPAPASDAPELAMGGGVLNDLSDRELASLLKDIESLDGVPSADVETPSLAPLGPRSGRRGTP